MGWGGGEEERDGVARLKHRDGMRGGREGGKGGKKAKDEEREGKEERGKAENAGGTRCGREHRAALQQHTEGGRGAGTSGHVGRLRQGSGS